MQFLPSTSDMCADDAVEYFEAQGLFIWHVISSTFAKTDDVAVIGGKLFYWINSMVNFRRLYMLFLTYIQAYIIAMLQ